MEAQREKNLSSHKGVLPEVAEVGFKPRLSAPEHGIESLSYIIKKKNSRFLPICSNFHPYPILDRHISVFGVSLSKRTILRMNTSISMLLMWWPHVAIEYLKCDMTKT